MKQVHRAIEPGDREQGGGGRLDARDQRGAGGGGGWRGVTTREDPQPDGARAMGPRESEVLVKPQPYCAMKPQPYCAMKPLT